MPWQANSGIRGDPWSHCDRCGWQYRLSQLTTQNGLLLCLTKCYDNPTKMLRNEFIADILGNSKIEAENRTAFKRQEPNVVRGR